MNTGKETVFDFSDASHVAAWSPLNDVVMGWCSSSRVLSRQAVLRFEGEVSLEHGGGFASMRCDVELDLSGASGLSIRARGDGATYKIGLYDESGPRRLAHRYAFEATREWRDIDIPFSELNPEFRGRDMSEAPPLDTSRVRGISVLIADKQAGPFWLELERISVAERRP